MRHPQLELLSPREMSEADGITVAGGVSGQSLMERAGAAVTAVAKRLWPGGKIVVLSGPGNNGGDGWIAARLLRDLGFQITVAAAGDRGRLSGDAKRAAEQFDGEVLPAEPDTFEGAGLIVDALYGAGFRPPLSAAAAALVGAVNRSNAIVVSVDLPSGVDGETGEIGELAIEADETVTFFRLKTGHKLLPGRTHCGPITLAQIGIGDRVLESIAPNVFRNLADLWVADLPVASEATHKYRRGHTLVLSGPSASTGAARLAAIAALRAGSGLVSIASPPDALLVNSTHLTAIMLRRMASPDGLAAILDDARFNAVVLGPGLGISEESARRVETALRAGRQVVLDADALASFAGEPDRLFQAIAGGDNTVLTPHMGEFGRLFSDLREGSKLSQARAAASRSGAVVLLKGADTVIAAPGGWACINENAPSTLATAGAGDVLAGIVGGLLAQGMAAPSAAAAAVWIHGRAAELAGPGLIAEDLPDRIPDVMSELARIRVGTPVARRGSTQLG
ncbi:MAG: NAD(P)H-hydrate dehydratase [Alphaproteobacteria bacterium]